ncbi:MAG: 50S ribosomal protein L24 [Bacillota bacterium]
MHIKSGDTVVVISGKDKGKTGKVMKVLPKDNKVIIEGVNMVTKHKKPGGPGRPGGIVQLEGAVNGSKVMIYCPKDKAGVRVAYQVKSDGSKVRVCKKCGEVLDKK